MAGVPWIDALATAAEVDAALAEAEAKTAAAIEASDYGEVERQGLIAAALAVRRADIADGG